MAAVAAVTRFAAAGQEVVLSDDSYGGTYRLLAQVRTGRAIPKGKGGEGGGVVTWSKKKLLAY